MPYTFGKEERLCSQKLIDRLYAEGHRLMAFPYSVQWLLIEGSPSPCQVMIVAPKRKFHHAVDRNRVRRLTRECWRHRKSALYDFLQENNLSIALAMVYIHNEIMPSAQIGHKMDKLIEALEKEIVKSQKSGGEAT